MKIRNYPIKWLKLRPNPLKKNNNLQANKMNNWAKLKSKVKVKFPPSKTQPSKPMIKNYRT